MQANDKNDGLAIQYNHESQVCWWINIYPCILSVCGNEKSTMPILVDHKVSFPHKPRHFACHIQTDFIFTACKKRPSPPLSLICHSLTCRSGVTIILHATFKRTLKLTFPFGWS